MSERAAPIERLSFVYDADGTFVGEVRYVVGALFGRAHCSLCDVTHGLTGKRASFKRCAEGLDIPIEYFHRNDVPAAIASLVQSRWPVVVGHGPDGDHLLLDHDALEDLAGDVERFEVALRSRLDEFNR